MSKTNDTSNIGTLEDHDTIGDTDLGAVTGAWNAVEHVVPPVGLIGSEIA